MAKTSIKQEKILDFIKEKGEVLQPEITEHFLPTYSDKKIARINICILLKKLQKDNLIKVVRTEKNEGSGGIDKNVWSAV